ncbi:cytochrome c3 family protein [Desulfogranum japonicum]|uniref:cytochrome c3 family protein n=1 Tax=Desulfogranum japonicum TaxID=231447 RepID=UPI0004099A89|nr:cytochrome c3 family protein [Desulfogranum japonicum]
MNRKNLCRVWLVFGLLAFQPVYCVAADGQGPEEIILTPTIDIIKVPKPAYLPHHTHQWLECDACHHTQAENGKKVEYIPGQAIQKCESCHNSKAGMPERVSTLKRAAHVLCMECHRQQDKELTKCGVCHTTTIKSDI